MGRAAPLSRLAYVHWLSHTNTRHLLAVAEWEERGAGEMWHRISWMLNLKYGAPIALRRCRWEVEPPQHALPKTTETSIGPIGSSTSAD